MTREEVKQLLMNITVYYPSFKVSDVTSTVNAWYSMLADEDCGKIAIALKEYIKTDRSQFAPSIGQLLAAETKPVENESVAWSQVMKAIGRSSYYAQEEFDKLPPDVQQAVGTPAQLRQWAITNDLNMSVESSNFYKRLATVRERARADKIMGRPSWQIETKPAVEIEERRENIAFDADAYLEQIRQQLED